MVICAVILSSTNKWDFEPGPFKEADELVNAQKYERSSGRQGYRSGHYKRNFQTTAGEVELNVPKLKGVPFETMETFRISPPQLRLR